MFVDGAGTYRLSLFPPLHFEFLQPHFGSTFCTVARRLIRLHRLQSEQSEVLDLVDQ